LVKELSTPDLLRHAESKKPKVYITRRLPDQVETRMRELFDAELNINDEPRAQPELVAAMRSADVLVPT
jgi:glyoxylate reductase